MNLSAVPTTIRELVTRLSSGWTVEHAPSGRHTWNWKVPAFDANRFKGDGTITWTVASSDRLYEHYGVLGDVLCWSLEVTTSSTGGTASSALRVSLPAQYRIKSRSRTMCHVQDAGGTTEVGHVVAVADQRFVSIRLADSTTWSNAASNNTYVSFTVFLRVY